MTDYDLGERLAVLAERIERVDRHSAERHDLLLAEVRALRQTRDKHDQKITRLEQWRQHADDLLAIVRDNQLFKTRTTATDAERQRHTQSIATWAAIFIGIPSSVAAVVTVVGMIVSSWL